MSIPFFGDEASLLDPVFLASLQYLPYQLCLILSNLFFLPPIIIAYVFGRRALAAAYIYFVVGVVLLAAMIISFLYHTCQTTGYCALESIVYWTMGDHVTSGSMIAMVTVFTVTPVTLGVVAPLYEKRLKHILRELRDHSGENGLFAADRIARWQENRNSALRHDELSQAWWVSLTVAYIFVVVFAVFSHPFSLQAFIIIIAFGLAAVFFRLVVLEHGDARDFAERLSVPDLVVGVIFFAISLVFFMLDGYMYWLFHSLWHMLSGIGLFFYICGLSAHTMDFISPCASMMAYFRSAKRRGSRV
jgi:hypothetical protein